MFADPDPVTSTSAVWPLTNSWQSGDHHGITAVQAGRSAKKGSETGILVVWRYRIVGDSQQTDLIEVPGAGTLRITDAPLGRKAARRGAGDRAEIEFVGEGGVRGVLNLEDDSITLEP